MGFLDLSIASAAKKHVDFNDARYQLADKLRWNGKQTTRSTFTLYDSKDENKVSIQDISAAYALSDKRLPMGELLNKMVDLTMDMEDGRLDTEKDAVYTWKYSAALIAMYEDKVKRQEPLSTFDNGLKASVINSKIFMNRYPGKYTNRTNFFDQKVKEAFTADIVETFKDVALPGIHESAIRQSKEIAEKHNNPTLDRIVQWAVENYKCDVDSFFEVREDIQTHLFYSMNTIILHLKNGYDMSIIGYVGTEHDDQFAISVLDTQNIAISQHNTRINQDDLKDALSEASSREKIDPLTKLLKMEKQKNLILKQQYDILIDVRPMVPADVLELQAAESVVGADYIWGCKQFRETHEDLPANFKLEDLKLPRWDGEDNDLLNEENKKEIEQDIERKAHTMTTQKADAQTVEHSAKSLAADVAGPIAAREEVDTTPTLNLADMAPAPIIQQPASAEELVQSAPMPEDLFAILADKPKPAPEKKFGDLNKDEFKMPMLAMGTSTTSTPGVDPKQKEQEFDASMTLLPGVAPKAPPKEEFDGPSVTGEALPLPVLNIEPTWKEPQVTEQPKEEEIKEKKPKEEPKQPELLFDDISDLFA